MLLKCATGATPKGAKETEAGQLLILNEDEISTEHRPMTGHRQRIAVPAHYAHIGKDERPARVEKLVSLAAFLLPGGQAMPPVAMSDTRSVIFRNLVVHEDQGYLTAKEEAYREAMYGDCSDEDVALATSLLTPEPLAPLATPLDLSERNFGRVPRVYIETLCDDAVTLSAQGRMVPAMLCASVISTNTSHSPFCSAPQELAHHLSSP